MLGHLSGYRIFLSQLGKATVAKVYSLNEYGLEQHDVVINCIGFGNPQKLKDSLGDILRITTMFDDLIIDYLEANPNTIYVNFSSGAAYSSDFLQPVNDQSKALFTINAFREKSTMAL